jgi:hypothetical protein
LKKQIQKFLPILIKRDSEIRKLFEDKLTPSKNSLEVFIGEKFDLLSLAYHTEGFSLGTLKEVI